MRSLGIALCAAWLSVGFDLLWLPPSQLQSEISLSRDYIESMQTSPLKDTPEMQQGVEQSKRLLANQSRRGIVLWVAWTALLVVVVYGVWSAYAVFRHGSSAFGHVLIGCFLFIGHGKRSFTALHTRFYLTAPTSFNNSLMPVITKPRLRSFGITMYLEFSFFHWRHLAGCGSLASGQPNTSQLNGSAGLDLDRQ